LSLTTLITTTLQEKTRNKTNCKQSTRPKLNSENTQKLTIEECDCAVKTFAGSITYV